MNERLVWERDGSDWPNREASRFATAAGIRWHVQQMGSGPALLLLHGTGAATHSWRALAPLLAQRFTVVAPDLPGHGFTDPLPRSRLSLPGMAEAIGELVKLLDIDPALAVGHSAGAAILARMSIDGRIDPAVIVSLNGALLPLPGLASLVFPPVAKLLFLNPFVPRLVSRLGSDPAAVERLIDSTGSRIEPAGRGLYHRLMANSGHIAGVLGMMASWDLWPLQRDLARLRPALLLAVGSNDGTVSPAEADRVAALVPAAHVVTFPGLGHLAHEEEPEKIAQLIIRVASEHRVVKPC